MPAAVRGSGSARIALEAEQQSVAHLPLRGRSLARRRPSPRSRRRVRAGARCLPRAPARDPRRREGTARPPTLQRGQRRRLVGPPPTESGSAAEWLLACAQHASCCRSFKRYALGASSRATSLEGYPALAERQPAATARGRRRPQTETSRLRIASSTTSPPTSTSPCKRLARTSASSWLAVPTMR